MTRRIIRTITTATAIAALAAPAALARPADMPPAVASHAAVEQHKQARMTTTPRYPTRPAQGEQANPRPETPPPATAGDGIAWTTIGLGIAGGLLTIGAIAGVASRTHRTGRIAA